MRGMYPNRAFKVLIGAGAILALLLGAAAYRAILAGCPDSAVKIDLTCLFLPTHTDLGIHLLSYAFIGTILLGASFWLVLWHRQRTGMALFTRNLVVLRASDSELELLTLRLGLKDKVSLLDSEVPLCFCAGFISPHIYLSRGMIDRLTTEQLEALLLHEKHHLENYDPLKTLLGRLVASALFFIPVLPDIFKRYLIEKEIAADQKAIRQQGHYRGIAGALNKLLREHSTVPAKGWAVGGAEALEYRIDNLLGRPPQDIHHIPLRHIITSFLITTVFVVTILVPLPGSHPLNGDMASALFSLLA